MIRSSLANGQKISEPVVVSLISGVEKRPMNIYPVFTFVVDGHVFLWRSTQSSPDLYKDMNISAPHVSIWWYSL